MQGSPDYRGRPSDALPPSPAGPSPRLLLTDPTSQVLDAAFELAAVGLALTDEQGRFVRVNRAYAQMCGYAAEELVGRDAIFLLAPEEREEAERRRRDRAADPASVPALTRDWQIITRDGRRRYFRTTSTTLLPAPEGTVGLDPPGAPGLWLLVSAIHDVTAERETKTALLEAGQRLNSVLASITDGYLVLDEEFRFVEINPAALEMIFNGRSADELVGKVFWDEYPQGRDSVFYTHYCRALAERVPVHFEARSTIVDRWFETHAYPRDGRLEIYVRDISERKQSEQALRQALASVRDSEAHVRLIADNVPGLISYVDRALCYRFANSAYRDWFGIAPEQVVGRTIPQLLGPSDFEYRRPYIERALLGEAVRFEAPASHKSLGRRETETCYAPDTDPHDPSGPVRGFFVFVYDVTDRKRAERALREHEAVLLQNDRVLREGEYRLRMALSAAEMGIWEWDPAAGTLVWTAECFPLLGVRPEEFTGRTEDFARLVHPDDAAAIWAKLDATVRTGARLDHEFRVVRADDGRVRWIANHARRVGGGAGEPLRVVGTMRDISDRRQAEEALAASEREFRAIFELANSGKGQAEPATARFTRVNRKLCQITGYSEAELLGMTFYDITHPDDRDQDRRNMAALGRGEISHWQHEKRYVRKDGSVAWVSVAGSAIRDAAGRPVRLVATVQDISERKRAEEAAVLAREQAEAAKAAAEAANMAKDHFLAVLSHELRTPLTPVVMTLAGLEMDRNLSQGVRDDLAMIRRNVELETKLIDDLLDVTRIAHGKLRLVPQPADAHALIDGVVELFHSESRTKRVELSLELGASDARVSADGARLQQVFWNLVRNAIKFTPENGRVRVRTANPRPRLLRVEVSDTGIGIEPSALPRLFNAFEQAEQSITRQFGGLGLGLAISRALVELHGGTIRADSPGRGRGATFTVELPTVAAVEKFSDGIQRSPDGIQPPSAGAGVGPGAGPGNASTPLPGAAPALRPPTRPVARVLLVEDHADTLRVLKRLLERMGYAVVTASSAADALSALSNETVDVIVSDIGLPDGTGHEFIRKVKATSAHAGVPAIAISGFGMDADVRNSREAGFVAHMTKPLDVRQLDAAIRSAVNVPARPHPGA